MAKLIGDQQEQDEDEFWAEHADYFQSSDEDEEFEDDDLSGTPPALRPSPLPSTPNSPKALARRRGEERLGGFGY